MIRHCYKHLLILCTILLTSGTGFAQLNYLTGGFATFSSTYTDLGTGGTPVTMSNNDSGFSAPLPIGFTFTYNGSQYDSLIMFVDGLIKLGNLPASNPTALLFTAFNQPPTGGPFNNFTSTAYGPTAGPQDTNLIVPFGNDLWPCNTGRATSQLGAGTADFRISTTGTAGSRVCTIQWKNVSDKTVFKVIQGAAARNDSTQYDTINFQVKLFETTNAIEFVYGRWVISPTPSDAHFAACGLKGNNTNSTVAAQLLTITKGSAAAWSSPIVNSQTLTSATPLGNYNTTTFNALNYGNSNITARPAPDVGRVYHFNPVVFNDAAVVEVRAMGKVALNAYSPDSIKATIYNPGVNALSGILVTLTVSGTNSYTTSTTVSSLAPGAVAYVAFPPYAPTNLGASLITVSVPTDDNNTNNAYSYSLSVTNSVMGYTDTTRSFAGSNGTTAPVIYGSKYRVLGSRLVTSTRLFIPSNSVAVGVVCQGVVIDSNNTIVGSSAPYTLTAADMGAWVTFPITSPPTISNTYFWAGIYVVSGTGTYYLSTYQQEGTTYGTQVNINRPDAASYWSSSTAGVAPTPYGTGRYMIDATVEPLPANDVGVFASSPGTNANIPVNVNIPLRAYVKNFGTATRPAGVQVRYSVNGGPVKGPLSTSVAIAQGDTTSVLFTGTNSLNFSAAGVYTIKIYTSLAGDGLIGNDTLTIVDTAVVPYTAFPYRIANGIASAWSSVGNSTGLWKNASVSITQPNGVASTGVLQMDNFNAVVGADAKLVSPVFSFAGMLRPTLHFHVAHAPRTSTGFDDTLQVLVSTDGGASYTPVYSRTSQLSSPTLGTVATQNTSYTPAGVLDWRHEAVDLSAYANNTYVVIALRGKTATGNGVYISNIIVSNPATISIQPVFSPTIYTHGAASVNFFSSVGAFTGELHFSRYDGLPFSAASPVFATNSAATTANSNVFTPTNVWTRWWTIAYSGTGTGNPPSGSQYYFQVDITGIGGMPQPDNLYLLKRSESNGSWVAQATTRSGSILIAGPLTGFSDFSIGSQPAYNTLPVSWLGFTAKRAGVDVALNWSTASEINSSRFVVQRSTNGEDFVTVGEVKATGNSEVRRDYRFSDLGVPAGSTIVYYRLLQEDRDGRQETSKVLSVDFNHSTTAVVAYPNPFTKDMHLLLSATASDIQINVTDLRGRVIFRKQLTGDGQSVIRLSELNRLDAGFYLMNVTIEGNTQTIKLNKAE